MKPMLRLAAALGLAMSLAQAHAAMVTEWSYTLTAKWSSATNTGGGTTTGVGTQTLAWGTSTGQGQSQLIVANPAPGSATTNGAAAAGVTVTHNNRPITGNTLDLARLEVTLFLAPLLPDPLPGSNRVQNIDIKFVETVNSRPCAVNGSTVCPDIFVLASPGQVQGAEQFMFDGYIYTLTVFPLNLNSFDVLPPAACTAAGLATGCIGFTTEENQSTAVPFGFRITARPIEVPEPASLALVGLGLAGLGVAARRRRAG